MRKRRIYTEETRTRRREYYKNNRQHIRQREKAARENNLVRYAEYDRRYYLKNSERIKQTQREKNIKHRYGITYSEYLNWCERQNNICPLCKKQVDKLCIDHDHTTNKIRGLICVKCNSALGLAEDNIDVLTNMIEYLKSAI